MPICAVIDTKTGRVLNTIVAEPTDPAPKGTRFVLVELDTEKGAPCDTRYIFTEKDGVKPDAEYQAALTAEAEADALAQQKAIEEYEAKQAKTDPEPKAEA